MVQHPNNDDSMIGNENDAAIKPNPSIAGTDQPLVTPTKLKCPFCAEEIMSEAIKCRHCGERLDTLVKENGHGSSSGQLHSKRERKWAVLVICQHCSGFLFSVWDRW